LLAAESVAGLAGLPNQRHVQVRKTDSLKGNFEEALSIVGHDAGAMV
jgi:hypothetical protein